MKPATVIAGLCLVPSVALAQAAFALPAAPVAALDPQPGAALPQDAVLLDTEGRPQPFGAVFDGQRPVLLLPGYHGCAQLCGLVLHDVLQRWHQAGLTAEAGRIVFVSLDPSDTPASARRQAVADRAFAQWLAGPGDALPTVQRLTAPAQGFGAVERIARAAGIVFTPRGGDGAPIAHPAVLVVATPQGRIAGYLPAPGLQAGELAAALQAARSGHAPTWPERIALACAHFDPALGRWSRAAMALARTAAGAALAGLLALALLAWRQRR